MNETTTEPVAEPIEGQTQISETTVPVPEPTEPEPQEPEPQEPEPDDDNDDAE